MAATRQGRAAYEMVREGGLEPPGPYGHKVLSLARLPVPPLPHAKGAYIVPAAKRAFNKGL